MIRKVFIFYYVLYAQNYIAKWPWVVICSEIDLIFFMSSDTSDEILNRLFEKEIITPSKETAANTSILVVDASTITTFYSCQADNTIGKDNYNITLFRVGE